jgi:RNA polymerase primary sigma factor
MRNLLIHKQITHRDEVSIDKYLHEISKEELLTPEQEVELARRIRKNDQQALEKLVRANLRFVVSVAKKYQYRGLSLLDLINEGNLGLIKAAQRFDETKGFKFISYAVWWIRQSIIQALAEQGRTVRLPLNKVNAITKIYRTFSEIEQKYEREPTQEELSQALHWSPETIKQCWQNSNKPVSMDAPLNEEDEYSFSDTVKSEDNPPDDDLVTESLSQEIESTLSTLLTDKEASILRSFYGLGNKSPVSMQEIADSHKLSKERTRQIKQQAINKLKGNKHCRKLKAYLG